MPPEDAPPSAAVWPGHHILARQRNASGRCPQPPPIQNKHWVQVGSPSWCHIDVCLHPKTSDQDWSRDTMGPHPLDGAQTQPEWLAWQTRLCPQSGKILLELPWWTLHRWWPPDQGWMSGHSTILQRQYYGRPSWKPCWYQQSNGPGQNMHLLAWHGSRCDRLHQVVSHMHQVQQSTSQDAETPWGPPQTLGKNRCWLLSRPFGKKHLIVADYFSKFLYMFPVASAHHFKTITHLRELFAAEGIPTVVMSDNGPPFNGEEFRQFAHDFDFIHTTSSPHFHQSNGFIEAMVKKVKNAYKKTDGSPSAQAKALLQLCDTPIMVDLPSPAEILHGHHTQGAVLSRPSKRVNIHQIRERLIKLQEKQKENFDKAHRAKDLCILKVKEQVQFFHNKQGTGPIKWTTGTVTEILECGWSYMIHGPNSRVYRSNRAHLKPICHDDTSFQDHLVKKGKKQPKDISFQDHQPSKAKSMSFQKETSYMDTRSMLFDEPDTHQTPPTSPPSSPLRCYSPRSPLCSPPASFPSRESSVEPSSEDSSPEGRKRHQSEPAFIWPRDIDQGLSHGISALLTETSPLAP